MNKKGKEFLSREIADKIYKHFANQMRISIILKWNETPKPPSSTPNDPVHSPRAPTEPTKRECCGAEEIDKRT
jgi:hypothetical protein